MGLNRFRQFFLTEFINDLRRLENSGLSPDTCKSVQTNLAAIVNACKKCPENGFLAARFQNLMQRFHDCYFDWNSVEEGATPEKLELRKKFLGDLHRRRKRLSFSVGRRQQQITQEIDGAFFGTILNSLRNIVDSDPATFALLGRALRKTEASL